MKKLLFILLSALSLTTFAQTKKVAILDVVDRENKLNYSQKLLLRSNMARAVSNTAGYEAYDRTDMDAILSEHNFQRTGYVSNDQIAKLGEMTGAQYVLIIEAVGLKSQELYVTIKLLDVETAHIDVAGNELMNNNAQDIIRGCQILAKSVFKPNTVKIKKEETSTIQGVQWYNGQYIYNGEIIGKSKAASLVLREICENSEYWKIPEFKEIKKSKAFIISGYCLLGIGAGLVACGAVLWTIDKESAERAKETAASEAHIWHGSEEATEAWIRHYEDRANALQKEAAIKGPSVLAIGAAALVTSIPLLTIGYKNRDKALQKYVTNHSYSENTPIFFTLTVGQNGLGVAMNF